MRQLRLGQQYLARARSAGGAPRTPQGAAVGQAIAKLAAADLPLAGDFESPIAPTGRAWVHRVTGTNVWLWYRFTDAELTVVTLTNNPPVPIE